jgi:hypothetical protein
MSSAAPSARSALPGPPSRSAAAREWPRITFVHRRTVGDGEDEFMSLLGGCILDVKREWGWAVCDCMGALPEGVGWVRGWRLVPVAVATLGAAAAATVAAVAVNAATSGTAGWYRVVERLEVRPPGLAADLRQRMAW